MEEDLRSSGAGLRGFKSHPRHHLNHPAHSILSLNPKPFPMDIATVSKLMMLDGYPDSTINNTIKRLKNLAAEFNLSEPNTVKALLVEKKVSDGFKSNLCDAYGHFLDCHGCHLTLDIFVEVLF
jgi:hypothetical protein